jgi:glucose-1-phosphate cytidylyltransferase
MKVVILCGGRGTRLREETEFRPKPMVPIGDKPILWHIMKTYSHYGHKDFILCLGYKGEIIKDYFRNYLWHTCDATLRLGSEATVSFNNLHSEEDWNVTLANTGEDSATGARIKMIQRYISHEETFLMTYGDGLSTIDINASIEGHIRSKKILTVSAVHPAGRFGAMRIDETGAIFTFAEKPRVEDAYINGGYMVCNYRLFDYLREGENIPFEHQPMQDLVRNRQVNSYRHEGFWQPMDTYQEAQYLNSLWNEAKAPWKIW